MPDAIEVKTEVLPMLCPFCKRNEANLNLDGVPICSQCFVIFGHKLSNTKTMVKLALILKEFREFRRETRVWVHEVTRELQALNQQVQELKQEKHADGTIIS